MSADSPTTLLVAIEPSAMIRPSPSEFSSKPFDNVTLHECHRRDQRAQALHQTGKCINPDPDCAPLSVPFLVRQGVLWPITSGRSCLKAAHLPAVDLIDKAVRFMWDVSDWRGWRIVARMPPRSLYSPSFSRVVGPGADGLWAVFDQEHMSFKTSPMSLDGTARAAHHGLSAMEVAA